MSESEAKRRSASEAREEARDVAKGGGAERAGPDPRGIHFTRRLRRLYEISVLLTRFESVEITVPSVIALLAEALPLHSAVLIFSELEGEPRTIVWHAEGESELRIRAAEAHARAEARYLMPSDVALERPAESRVFPAGSAETAEVKPRVEGNFIHLPLVVARQPIFGALQLEGSSPFDELDLIFVNAVANQLAIALDRQTVISARQESAEVREREQRLLADVSALVGSSLNYQDTLAALARSAVPELADLCLIDEVAEDGTLRRREAVSAKTGGQREVADRMRRSSPGAGLQTKVLASRESILIGEISALSAEQPEADEDLAALSAAGITSLMVLPLLARGQTLGVLTFATAQSRRRYTSHDLELAEELARRASIAIDNARLYEQAMRATVVRENLLAIVSHDLKTPLGAILLNLSALLRSTETQSGGVARERLEVMQRSANRMSRLIEDLLETASIEAGRLSIELKHVAVAPLVAEALASLTPLATAKSIRLVTELATDLPAIEADGERLQQVLANLVGNAVKFTPPGGTITVRAVSKNDVVTLSVADTGPGIAEDEIAHIFDRFWQARRTARLGTGLGLFIVKGIVEAQRGKVWVESKPGHGSTFCLSLPVARRSTKSRPPSAE